MWYQKNLENQVKSANAQYPDKGNGAFERRRAERMAQLGERGIKLQHEYISS